LDDLRFYIGKDGETLWANKTVATVSKTKSKNIIKFLPDPKGQARLCKTRLEYFLHIISAKMIDKIVKYTNIFINKKRMGQEATSTTEVRARDYRKTTRGEILALFGALFLMALKRGNRADLTNFSIKTERD
jgi:hypothetical protein